MCKPKKSLQQEIRDLLAGARPGGPGDGSHLRHVADVAIAPVAVGVKATEDEARVGAAGPVLVDRAADADVAHGEHVLVVGEAPVRVKVEGAGAGGPVPGLGHVLVVGGPAVGLEIKRPCGQGARERGVGHLDCVCVCVLCVCV